MPQYCHVKSSRWFQYAVKFKAKLASGRWSEGRNISAYERTLGLKYGIDFRFPLKLKYENDQMGGETLGWWLIQKNPDKWIGGYEEKLLLKT